MLMLESSLEIELGFYEEFFADVKIRQQSVSFHLVSLTVEAIWIVIVSDICKLLPDSEGGFCVVLIRFNCALRDENE